MVVRTKGGKGENSNETTSGIIRGMDLNFDQGHDKSTNPHLVTRYTASESIICPT